MKLKELKIKLWENCLPYEDSMIDKLSFLVDLTLKANQKMNLTAIEDFDSFIEKMVFDSALGIKEHEGFENKKLLDFGSGAGFPGLVIAILFPALHVTLLDATKKKTIHLVEMIKELELENVDVVNTRGEIFVADHREYFDYVIARAVAPLNILIELTSPLIKLNGELIAMKGKNGLKEYEDALSVIKKLGLKLKKIFNEELPESHEERMNFVFDKIALSPKKYPRSYAEILAKPL